jgi:hypothetical protein
MRSQLFLPTKKSRMTSNTVALIQTKSATPSMLGLHQITDAYFKTNIATIGNSRDQPVASMLEDLQVNSSLPCSHNIDNGPCKNSSRCLRHALPRLEAALCIQTWCHAILREMCLVLMVRTRCNLCGLMEIPSHTV